LLKLEFNMSAAVSMYQKTCLEEERRKMRLSIRSQQQHPLQQGRQIHAKEAV
jgi:hypothetical protein